MYGLLYIYSRGCAHILHQSGYLRIQKPFIIPLYLAKRSPYLPPRSGGWSLANACMIYHGSHSTAGRPNFLSALWESLQTFEVYVIINLNRTPFLRT